MFPSFFLEIINGDKLQIPVKSTPSLQPSFNETSATLAKQSKITNTLQLRVANPITFIPDYLQWQHSAVKFKKHTPQAILQSPENHFPLPFKTSSLNPNEMLTYYFTTTAP